MNSAAWLPRRGQMRHALRRHPGERRDPYAPASVVGK